MIDPSLSLFTPDLFCQSNPKFKAVPLTKVPSSIFLFLKQFGFKKPDVQILAPSVSLVNSSIYKISHLKEDYILKIMDKKKYLSSRILLVKKINDGKDIFFPKPLDVKKNKPVLFIQNRCHYLMNFVDGHYLGASAREIENTVKHLGKLSCKLKYLKTIFDLPKRTYRDTQDKKTFIRLNSFSCTQKTKKTPLKAFWPYVEKNYIYTSKKMRILGWPKLPKTLCPIDIHPHNVLITPSNKICFLDYESLYLGNSPACLGFAIFKILRNFCALKGKVSSNLIDSMRKHLIQVLLKEGAIRQNEIPYLSLGARLENIKRFLHGFHENPDNYQGGLRTPIFGKALAGEIDYIYNESIL